MPIACVAIGSWSIEGARYGIHLIERALNPIRVVGYSHGLMPRLHYLIDRSRWVSHYGSSQDLHLDMLDDYFSPALACIEL